MTANAQNFQDFLSANNLCTVLVSHFQASGNEEDTYGWHYELWDEDDCFDLPQNHRQVSLNIDEVELGVESLLMEQKRFHLWCTSKDDTTRITYFPL
jgi:hypothetical protein